jgi:predicted MFS family arabinose efflux permease
MSESMISGITQLMRPTCSAFLWTRIFGIPFWGLISMLSIILYKDMHIHVAQITAIIALKPMSGVLAPYWSQMIYQRPDRMKANLIWSHVLRYVPFLFIPWIDSAWVIILAFGFYMTLYKGAIPAWMEIFKRHVPAVTRERMVSYGSLIDFCGIAISPFVLGIFLDHYESAWRWLFPPMAILGLASTWFLWRIPLTECKVELGSPGSLSGVYGQLTEYLRKPWTHSWNLIRERPDFARYQLGFMLGGGGLMIIQPALPQFFVDTLALSYTEMLMAITLCKGVGFALASPFWTRLFGKQDISFFSGWVTLLAAIFPLLLLGAQSQIWVLYLAYCLYGGMQAGSELSWHMSGPVFSGEKDSSVFSGTNVLTVGIRGCFIPMIGSMLLATAGSTVVMVVASVMCLLATRCLIRSPAQALKAGVG